MLFWVLLGLSHEGAYTSRCQMPKFEQMKWESIIKEMAHKLVTIQNCLDLRRGTWMMRFVMEGMLEGVWEDVQFLLMVSMVPPFLSPIVLL